jgi:hypothetical protein
VVFDDFVLLIEYDEKNHEDRDINDEILRMRQIRDYFAAQKTSKKIIIMRYGNKQQSVKDMTIFLEAVRSALTKDTLEHNRIILAGYLTDPYTPHLVDPDEWQITKLTQ